MLKHMIASYASGIKLANGRQTAAAKRRSQLKLSLDTHHLSIIGIRDSDRLDVATTGGCGWHFGNEFDVLRSRIPGARFRLSNGLAKRLLGGRDGDSLVGDFALDLTASGRIQTFVEDAVDSDGYIRAFGDG